MRAMAGLLAFMAIVMIAVIMLISEWLKKRKTNIK
jgi:Flp pilus assembly pilin Flp